MAPRKTNKEIAPKKPVPRKRVQQKKPLKTPTMLKLKITTQKPDPDSSTPKLTEKQLGLQRKIELANEVALAQLYKNAEIIDNVTTTEPEKKKTKSKKNTKATPPSKPRIRQKRQKTISEFFNETAEADSAVVTKQPPKKIIKKTPGPRKRKTETSCPRIKSADSTVCKARRGRPQNKKNQSTSGSSRNLRSKKQVETGEAGRVNEDGGARAAAVSSRTNSGASSTPSWTRDISSSSTTTCVTVGDFVRIDQRLPVLQLAKIEASCAQPLAPAFVPAHSPSFGSDSASNSTSSSTSSSSSSSLTSADATGTGAASPALDSPPALFSRPTADLLNLSISSSERIEEAAAVATAPSEMDALLRQLIEGQKKLDRAFDDWMNQLDEPDSSDTDCGVALALSDLSLEPILLECRRVRQILKGEEENEADGDVKVDEPVTPASTQPDEDGPSGLYGGVVKDSEGGNYDDDEVSCDDNYTHFEHSPDDEDAISLFAESMFTDCGSSRRDEYVPRPIALPTAAARPSYPRVYKPTPITTQSPAPSGETSAPAPAPAGPPLLIADLYQPIHGTKSAVFYGVCFYHIAGGKCRNSGCRYLHIDITVEEIDRRIAALGEVDFIQEYMLIRAWTLLWRLYAPRYLCEAERRELTRLVLEMAMDFTMKARPRSHEDYLQRQAALEAALTRLSCDAGAVSACADLLRLSVPSATGKRPLQYLLLHSLADTANFSRFKRAFVELATLLEANDADERLESGPVIKILERICILPYEERLVRAMLGLVRLTDAAAVAPFMPQIQALLAALPDKTSDEPSPAPLDDPPPPLDDPPPPPVPPMMSKPMIRRPLDFLRLRGYPPPRQFRGQRTHPRGRATGRGRYLPTYPGYQHSPIFRRRPPSHFSNHN